VEIYRQPLTSFVLSYLWHAPAPLSTAQCHTMTINLNVHLTLDDLVVVDHIDMLGYFAPSPCSRSRLPPEPLA